MTHQDPFRPTYHRDGSITWWSVYRQYWVRSTDLSDEEWAARSSTERERMQSHFQRHGI